jgi:glycosyltransferase involved in cell wall biosynthesis
MRILYLLGSLNIGGAEKLVFEIFKISKSKNLNVSLIHRKGGLLLKDFENLNLPLHYLSPRNFLKYFFKLRHIIKTENISVVHAHQVIDALLSYIVLFGTSTKLILTLHGHGINDNYIQRFLRNFILEKTDINIYVSHSLQNYYFFKNNIKEGKHEVLYNGISFPEIENTTKSNPIKIGMVGNFTSVRDHATVCRFLNLLEKENFDFNFIFVGAKSTAEYWLYDDCILACEELIKKGKVSFLGSRKDVPEILNSLDCFIYASEHDTFGIAVVEAMAMGVPVLVNDWEVMREITNDGAWASIYKSKDEYDLLNKFLYYFNNIETYRTTAQRNAPIIRDTYSIEKHISNLISIYNSII